MAAASTCSGHSLHGAYCDNAPPQGAHINSSHNRPLRIVPPTTLASSPPRTTTNPGDASSATLSAIEVELASQSISALNIMGVKDTMLHVTELPMETTPDLAVIEQPSSPKMETVEEVPSIEPEAPAATSSPASTKHRTPKRKRTASPPSPASTNPSQHVRSASRSTRRSAPPSSRPGSLHSHRRTVTTSSLTSSSHPSPSDPETRRQNLLALHRESCRLFQNNGRVRDSEGSTPSPSSSTATTHTPPRTVRAYSDLSTPPLSPILDSMSSTSQQRPPFPPPLRTCSAFTPADSDPISPVPIHPSATVIDWTSPSTRRREYKKIDRASSGVRGFWRRVAPRWARFGDDRTPFFEEGKDGKGNYEGSVRRFRMDLPDEGPTRSERAVGLKLKRKLVVWENMREQSYSAPARIAYQEEERSMKEITNEAWGFQTVFPGRQIWMTASARQTQLADN
ncbi:uncharacterized protein KD926_001851 [Aspergillus affinis]|uniref:uncharacterized protein n=1 Tax=Aspergillus affinis TaxID=1070780 RepID=UPI0022FF0317|nr:uncharacterized protein KD926_001851 [Aspergillus affinis]KAI9036396.1 hypothetical protein KD926_001851 [Aspergillus affinis]